MKKRKHRMQIKTIRFRLMFTVSILILGSFMICLLANQLFLPSFYQYGKCKSLSSLYTKVNQVVSQLEDNRNVPEHNISLGDTSELMIEKLSEESNTGIYIIKWERFYSVAGASHYGTFIYPSQEEWRKISQREQNILDQMGNLFGNYAGFVEEDENTSILYNGTDYQIVKMHDERLDSDYLELVGKIDINGTESTIYMRSNYESIQESVKLSSRFLAYAALVSLLIAIFVMFWISNGFTKPIVKLSRIAREMSELKFETKYTEYRGDELDELGNSVNVLSEKLEETISELKAANNELQNDIEEKIQIDEMRKEFLSNVTHELKTPIALIQGYAEGLQDNINDDPESREFYCEVIIDEANKMNNMVKKLLNLNQIEFGKNQIEYERFDVVQVIRSVLDANRILIEQKEVMVRFDFTESVYVWADEYMTQEVITNYISNALNHVDGQKVITITLCKTDEVVRISVKNTGEQIPEEDLEKVWIKFYKVDKARTREYGGSGIGLSIVKAIMDSMHRECGVKNCEDGVEFWFELDIKSDK